MSMYTTVLGQRRYHFKNLAEVMAKATPGRSGDHLAGIAATSAEERVAAQMCLAELPLQHFIETPLIPYETDEVTRLLWDGLDSTAAKTFAKMRVGELRDWLLAYETTAAVLAP